MAKLTKQQQTFIVQRLACFDSPSEVAKAVYDELGIQIERTHVQRYDPTKAAGVHLSKPLRAIFEQTRERFLTDTTEIAVSHKAVRLRRLGRMADKAEEMKNYALAAQLLEQIAKECGDAFTNLRKVAPTDPTGEKPYQEKSDDEIDARIQELAIKYGYNLGGED